MTLGIYQGYPLRAHDVAWTCALELTQDSFEFYHIGMLSEIIKRSGNAGIVKE